MPCVTDCLSAIPAIVILVAATSVPFGDTSKRGQANGKIREFSPRCGFMRQLCWRSTGTIQLDRQTGNVYNAGI